MIWICAPCHAYQLPALSQVSPCMWTHFGHTEQISTGCVYFFIDLISGIKPLQERIIIFHENHNNRSCFSSSSSKPTPTLSTKENGESQRARGTKIAAKGNNRSQHPRWDPRCEGEGTPCALDGTPWREERATAAGTQAKPSQAGRQAGRQFFFGRSRGNPPTPPNAMQWNTLE